MMSVCQNHPIQPLKAADSDTLAPALVEPEARTLLVLLNTFSLVLLTAQKLAAVGQPEERCWMCWTSHGASPVVTIGFRTKILKDLKRV